jgi:hypothetical protein
LNGLMMASIFFIARLHLPTSMTRRCRPDARN